jgi:anthranilate phosphoribosyltransferase
MSSISREGLTMGDVMDPRTSWPALLDALTRGESLSTDEAAWAMNEIWTGAATDVQIAGFVLALRAKGETAAEVAGLADTMLAHAVPIEVSGPVADLVGTGGDRAHTVNVSTMGAIVAAAAGVKLVKHGNRAASSSCGAADLLLALGVVIDLPPARTARLAEKLGIAFCFAPVYHPAMKYASKTRAELGIPTVFNFLGPLANPVRPGALAVGVSDPRMCGIVAGVLAERNCSALVFRGDDGLDELTTTSTSTVWIVRNGTVTQVGFDPADLDIARARPSDLRGADAAHNADVARTLLHDRRRGPVRDIVQLNAAAAVVVAAGAAVSDRASLTQALGEAWVRTGKAIDSGAAGELLERWIATSQELAETATDPA